MYSHGPVTGGSRQVSLGHCAGGTHLSPNSTRPSGQKHPGDNTSQHLKYAITAWYDPYLVHTEWCSLHPHPGCHKYVDKQNNMWWAPCPQDTGGRGTLEAGHTLMSPHSGGWAHWDRSSPSGRSHHTLAAAQEDWSSSHKLSHRMPHTPCAPCHLCTWGLEYRTIEKGDERCMNKLMVLPILSVKQDCQSYFEGMIGYRSSWMTKCL